MTLAPNALGLADAARAIGEGKLRSIDLVEACLQRIAQRDPEVRAWAHIDADALRGEAIRADATTPQHPLHGVPLAIKDIIDTADLPTEYGSPIYRGHQPAWDAACVALARRAGALVLGKTVTTEFAYFRPGPTANPHRLEHTPGGSSSGTAAAVADLMAPAGFGTQTAASVTRPAAYCGVVGYKASHGDFPLAGIKPLAWTLDSFGLIAREVQDVQLLRACLLRDEDRGAHRRATAPPRIAYCRTPWWLEADQDARTSLENAAESLRQGGAEVVAKDLPGGFEELSDVQKRIMACEAASSLAFEYGARRELMSPALLELIGDGLRTPRSEYLMALERAREARTVFAKWMEGFDAVLAPSAPGAAPVGLERTGDPLFSRMWTLLQGPSVTIPSRCARNGLPLGVQLVGKRGDDERVLDAARWAEPLVRDSSHR